MNLHSLRMALLGVVFIVLFTPAGGSPASADVPARCAGPLQAVEALTSKAEDKLFEVEITLKHGWGAVKTLSNADALIERLGEYVIATGQLTSAYSTFIVCVAE